MLIVAFGVLGFVGLQARTAVVNVEGSQRAQALILAEDMASRLRDASRADAPNFVAASTDYIEGAQPSQVCPTGAAAREVCEWGKLIRGASELQGTTAAGSIRNARGCIQQLAPDTYLVAIFWEGVQASADAPLRCQYNGNDFPTSLYGTNLRRGVSVVVRKGVLS